MQEFLEHIPHGLQLVSLFLLSMFKSYTGSSLSAVFNMGYFEMISINLSAAFISILLTYRFRHLILKLFQKRSKSENGYSKKLKKTLQLWNRYGIVGTIIISPVLISIPLGVIILAHFKTTKTIIFTYLTTASFVWINIFYFITKYSIKTL